MDIAAGLLQGFAVAAQPANLLWCFVGVLLGTIVGIMPGLGPPATIAMPRLPNNSTRQGTLAWVARNMPASAVNTISATTRGVV